MTVMTQRQLIHGLKRKVGFLRYQPCSLVLDDETLLVSACDKSARGAELAARYSQMTGDEILAESSDNVAIPANQVEKIRVDRSAGGGIDTGGGPDRIILKTLLGKQVFVFTGKGTDAGEAKRLLAERFGHKVR
jgi:hypothetical protein